MTGLLYLLFAPAVIAGLRHACFSKPDRTVRTIHNTVAQRQFLIIFPFLQTNITSQMWPSGGKGGTLAVK